jgi:hypothetical protein
MEAEPTVTTESQYRKYAHECADAARLATSDEIRKQFLDVAKLWLMAADRLANGAGDPGQSDGRAPPKLDGTVPNEPS